MHVNHRRKNRTHNGGLMSPYSLRWWKKQAAHDWRARTRHLMENEEWDSLTVKVVKNILWEYY